MDKVKILVVDDESRMRKLVRDFLTRQNYEVLEAADGEEALDIFYKDNPKAGERRRVWASCQVDGYSDIAGGHSFRQNQGERMRFKVLHKISDYKKRFGYHMCVGCGRCENVCPEYISYVACLQKLKEKEGK